MTSTLVLGPTRASRTRHAASLLSAHPQVTLLSLHPEDEATSLAADAPEHWTVMRSTDLTRALLAARNPVIVDDLPTWVTRVLDDRDLWDDAGAARETVDALAEEVAFGLSALPFETVAISHQPASDGSARAELLAELVERLNARVSATSTFVLEVRAGRVLDLSDAPLAAEL